METRAPTPEVRSTRLCETCAGRVVEGISRCPHCGNQVAAPEFDPRGEPTGRELSALEKRILIAAVKAPGGSYIIHVLPTSDRIEGEIKAGDERLCGIEAVEAVEALHRAGYVEREHDCSVRLTDDGQRLACSL